ncbi:MAG: peptidoglycan DD-metalloendopeptidase family protein [Oscillospiraceae bacterium]|nr:peptidoglycan DD-metalloendopeptidase family protein [Oscillospiraceae bacterium]
MKKNNRRRFTALLCAVGLIIGGAFPCPVLADDDDFDMDSAKEQIAGLNQAYDELEKQKQALANQISSVQSQKKQQSAERNELEQKISLTTQQIEVLTEKISALDKQIEQQQAKIDQNNRDIADKEVEIEQKQQEIEHNEELLRQRIRRSYMAGEPSTLEVLLGADSFYTMLSSTTMVTRMVNRDKDLLENLADQKLGLLDDYDYLEGLKLENEQVKAEFEASRAENEETRSQYDEQTKSLEEDVEKITSTIQSLEDTEREYYANQAKIQKEMQEAQAEIAQIYAALEEARRNSSGSDEFLGDDGDWGWPLPGYKMLTSNYGWRFNNSDFHTGLDISGPQCYGKTIVASNPGTVAFVNTSYKAGVGYGIYVIVDHGGGYSTLYAHMSAVDVSVGDIVVRGSPIGKVGATGWATGPHLHFEVRINGKTQDPLAFLHVPS